MNQFLILIRGKYQMGSPEETQKSLEKFGEWVQKTLDGRYVGGAPLENEEARLLNSKSEVLTDGPFLESKEMISGYMIINAKDVQEATGLAAKCPLLGRYELEIRKLKPMP
jgi:hypothetical protein